ncbi:SDR family oxidoreductase [Streptomyces sp. NPDC001156]
MALGTAVIVGVGPGLGLAIARTFVHAGHSVAMLARDKARLDTYAAELASTGQDIRGYVADAADPDNLRAALHCAITELGAPDVLVYNVGVLRKDSALGGDDQDWADVTAINVLGARVAADAVLPELRDGRGSLLFTKCLRGRPGLQAGEESDPCGAGQETGFRPQGERPPT